ncbi:hypothetical protein ACROYT_G033717 [Oculina patagonica]
MANLSGSNFTNGTRITTEGDTRNIPQEVSFIITIIINGISCPFTVLLNVLVIMAVKRRPRLQSNTNILLACLAATDVLTGLLVQPSFIAWKSIYLLNAYVILYRETRRHEKKIKTQQLPQEEVERFAKESKALKTTVFVVSAVMISFLPMALTLLLVVKGLRKQGEYEAVFSVLSPTFRTCAMLNSLLNPLIYCLRQKEMRKFVLRLPCQAVEPTMN